MSRDDRRHLPIRRSRPGWYHFDLAPDIRSLIVELSTQVASTLDQDLPLNRRLFPTAYLDDPDRDAGYQVLARGELIDQRHSAIGTVAETAEATEVDEATLTAWLTVTNDIRLVLGTQLDVSEDDDPDEYYDTSASDDGPPWRLIYAFLGEVVHLMVEALAESLDVGRPADEDEDDPA